MEAIQKKHRNTLKYSIPFSFDTMLASVRDPIFTRGLYDGINPVIGTPAISLFAETLYKFI